MADIAFIEAISKVIVFGAVVGASMIEHLPSLGEITLEEVLERELDSIHGHSPSMKFFFSDVMRRIAIFREWTTPSSMVPRTFLSPAYLVKGFMIFQWT